MTNCGQRCPSCGAHLRGDEAGRSCPVCLMRLALEPIVHTAASSEHIGVEPSEVSSHPDTPRQVGPYRILSVLGQGGMGVVYLAEQSAPVRRQVAIKLIKRGMDTREVIARFESERQALAMMSHPNIASVYDAGAAADGRPYFVMEHVKGVTPRAGGCATCR